MQMFNILNFGVGTALGSIVAAICTEHNVPTWGFGVSASVSILLIASGFMLSDDVETNKYALVKDELQLKYESQWRVDHADQPEAPQLNFCERLCMKTRALCSALRNGLILKFFGYLILSGFCMPSFGEFDYFFAIDELNIRP